MNCSLQEEAAKRWWALQECLMLVGSTVTQGVGPNGPNWK